MAKQRRNGPLRMISVRVPADEVEAFDAALVSYEEMHNTHLSRNQGVRLAMHELCERLRDAAEGAVTAKEASPP